MKYKIDKAAFDALEPSLQAFYKAQGDDYVLAIEGMPEPQNEDVTGLKNKIEELLGEKKSEAKRRQEAEEAAQRIAEEAARKSGDVDALEKSWSEKYTKREQELASERDSYAQQIKNLTVGRAATDLASEMAIPGSAKALLPHIQARLSMDVRDGKPIVVVLDAEGKPSAATLAELKTEFANDPAFAPLIVGTHASGGGAGGAKAGGGAAKTWNDLSGMERVELRRNNPAEHARLKAAAAP